MEEYILDLISRMNHKDEIMPGVNYSSAHSTSFKAYREAEHLESTECINILVKMIQKIQVKN